MSAALYADGATYPADDFSIEGQAYVVHRNVPYLLTLIDSELDETFRSEGVVLNVEELIASTLISMGGFPVLLGEHADIKASAIGFRCQNGEDILNHRDAVYGLLAGCSFETHRYSWGNGDSMLAFLREHYGNPFFRNVIFQRVCFALLKEQMLFLHRVADFGPN